MLIRVKTSYRLFLIADRNFHHDLKVFVKSYSSHCNVIACSNKFTVKYINMCFNTVFITFDQIIYDLAIYSKVKNYLTCVKKKFNSTIITS